MMDVASLRRMQSAKKQDTMLAGGERAHGWTDDKRMQLIELAQRTDCTAQFASKVIGMSITSVRREASKLNIMLVKESSRNRNLLIPLQLLRVLKQDWIRYAAIKMGVDYQWLAKCIRGISYSRVRHADAKLLPMLRQQWQAVSAYKFPAVPDLPNYKVNSLNDELLIKYSKVLSVEAFEHILRFNKASLLRRARELGLQYRATFDPRDPESSTLYSSDVSDSQLHWLYTLYSGGVAIATIAEATNVAPEKLRGWLSIYEQWEKENANHNFE